MRESKLLWHEDLSRGSVSHKGTPTSMLLKHSQRVLLLGHQVSPMNTIMVTLAPGSTKELLHQGRGSPHPPYKACRRHSTPSRRVEDVPASHQDSKDGRLTEYKWQFTLEPQHKVQQPCSLTHLGAILALSLTKDVLNLKMWSIWSLVGLEMFLDVCGSSLNSINSKIARGRRLYSPPSRTSRYSFFCVGVG